MEQPVQLKERMNQYIEPFWREKVVKGVFAGVGNIEIAYAFVLHPSPLGSIAISSGRIESLIKYKELMFNLYNAGYSVFIHDHRGQGLSGRMTDDRHQGYVVDFDDYISDFKIFYDQVIAPKTHTKSYLIGHSMGSAIATLYVLKHPDDFDKCVLSAPMFGILPKLPRWISSPLLRSFTFINNVCSSSPWYFLGQGKYQNHAFEQNTLTRSPSRYAVFRDAYEAQNECQLGGVTAVWLRQAYIAMRKIRKNAAQIDVPVLLLQASDDEIVDNCAQLHFAKTVPDIKVHFLEGAKHELFMEIDETRDECLRTIFAFLK